MTVKPVRFESGAPSASLLPGCLLAFEGPNGIGKTAIIEEIVPKIRAYLKERGLNRKVIVDQEPSVLVSNEIRTALDTDYARAMYYFFKGREEAHNKVVMPALLTGDIVVKDRYYHSTCVFQGMYVPVDQLFSAMRDFILIPHKTLILDAPGEIIEDRLTKRAESQEPRNAVMDPFEGQNITDHNNIRTVYSFFTGDLRGLFPDCEIVSVAGDLEHSVNNVWTAVLEVLDLWIDEIKSRN